MALYLKYRPQTFSDMVGQDFIKKTLKAAVAKEKTVGAYLFTGPRGTGKTSSARIFARAINCLSPNDGDPCLECEVCNEFAQDSLIDIIEIDAASHTGVDNIRDIIDKAQFQPTKTKYKIYIIDEVHMLSKGAFNALLKILEEPPKHVKFILATTEIHKVPETILSRCQRYDFKNFSSEDIITRLEYIAKNENISVDRESYQYIVKNAGGGMRNAVSLFEQLIVDDQISYKNIVKNLGISGEDERKQVLQLLLQKDVAVLSEIESMQNDGKNIKLFFQDLCGDLQSICRDKLEQGENAVSEVLLLDSIHEMLQKTKNSIDESMTLQIGVFKILSGASIASETAVETQKMSTPAQMPQKKQSKAEEINLGEVEDIFAASENTTTQTPPNTSAAAAGGASDFNIDTLIAEGKKLGAKAALSMSLKGAAISLDGENLMIKAKTKIALSTFQKTENRDIILQAAQVMDGNISDLKIS